MKTVARNLALFALALVFTIVAVYLIVPGYFQVMIDVYNGGVFYDENGVATITPPCVWDC